MWRGSRGSAAPDGRSGRGTGPLRRGAWRMTCWRNYEYLGTYVDEARLRGWLSGCGATAKLENRRDQLLSAMRHAPPYMYHAHHARLRSHSIELPASAPCNHEAPGHPRRRRSMRRHDCRLHGRPPTRLGPPAPADHRLHRRPHLLFFVVCPPHVGRGGLRQGGDLLC